MNEVPGGSDMENALLALTQNRPYVFVAMPFGTTDAEQDRWKDFFGLLRQAAEALGHVQCVRADLFYGGGILLEKVQRLIRGAALVVGEISDRNPNVMYEVGYAAALNRRLILLIRERLTAPIDLNGMINIQYTDTSDGRVRLRQALEDSLREHLRSPIPIWREMFEAPERAPAYIVAAPKYPSEGDPNPLRVYDLKTFGDNLCVRGLLQAFGAYMGEDEIELISGQFPPPNLAEGGASLYLIGSPKVNRVTGPMLEALQRGAWPNWQLPPRDGEQAEGNYKVVLKTDDPELQPRIREERMGWPGSPEKPSVTSLDCGIVVRGPHPTDPNRIVLIMAGPGSLGTGAACLTATRSAKIEELGAALANHRCSISDKKASFWALVQGTMNDLTGMLDEDGVEILKTGVYPHSAHVRR